MAMAKAMRWGYLLTGQHMEDFTDAMATVGNSREHFAAVAKYATRMFINGDLVRSVFESWTVIHRLSRAQLVD